MPEMVHKKNEEKKKEKEKKRDRARPSRAWPRRNKGSIALDGVSLTVNTVKDVSFSVLIIPHTLTVTTIGGWKAGDEVNIEVDLMARYAARLTEMK